MREKTKPRTPARPAKPAAREASRPTPRPSIPSPFKGGRTSGIADRTQRFVRDTRSELKKVVWPTRDDAVRLTMIVIAVAVAMGIVLGGVDYIFKLLFESLVTGF